MKKVVLPALLACISLGALAQKALHQVSTASGDFDPATLSIEQGDTVLFTVTGTHTATQVSEATYLANGTTPLAGGFNISAGVQKVVFNEEGTVYYICIPHVQFGMKGTIVVGTPLSIGASPALVNGIKVYPNPAQSSVTVQFPEVTQVQSISLMNAQGGEVLREAINGSISSRMINTADLEKGVYQVLISSPNKRYASKIVVQ